MTEFSDLSLDPRVLQAVSEAGYTTPTPIQSQAIPHALEGRDILGIAQTGTGKTAGFVLPMITHLSKGRARARMPRSLVLCPTRELAAQVAENFETYSKHVKLTMALLIGGVSFKDQDKLIDRGVDVLIATPGRLLDHFERGKLMLTGVQIMVVDEADRMLDMGFIPDIERIFKLVPFTRQTLFFSATMAPEITRITQEFLHNPIRVEVARQATASETIDQFVCRHKPRRKETSDSEKRELLRRIVRDEGDRLTNGIIFCNRKRDVDVLAKSLRKHGFDAQPLHGDLDQSMRTRILTSFRDGELTLLVASDVAARGLDIPSVSHVFNFDVPIHSEDYVHRIGRTGRAGRSGKSVTLCLPHEEKYLAKIEELLKGPIPAMPDPLRVAEPEALQAVAAAAPDTDEAEAPMQRQRPARRSRRRAADEVTPAPVTEAVPAAEDAPAPREQRSERPAPESRRRRGGGSDEGVVGMGDHVPAFLLRDLRGDFAATAGEEEGEARKAGREAIAEAPSAEATSPELVEAPARPRRRASRSRKAAPAADAAEASSEPELPTDAPEGAEVDAAADAEAPRKPEAESEAVPERSHEMQAPPAA